jgi:predicted pyridoxine 5'-phosphate oxidase superfamily flavin-nucleotide-binding protein
MGHKFAEIAFTPGVRALQAEKGSRGRYERMEKGEDHNHQLGPREAEFIAARDSFYMSSVSETGWPYLQHRGGPAGFLKVLDENTLGFADYLGNRQYVSTGNFSHDNRVALFFMDYPNRKRLKMLGRVRIIGLEESDLIARLQDDYKARIERGFVIEVHAYDWYCPQHITPRFTEAETGTELGILRKENLRLKALLAES